MEPIFENGGSAILMAAATFSPSCSISLQLPCKSGRAERGRTPALPRDHLQPGPAPAPGQGSAVAGKATDSRTLMLYAVWRNP
jgi:hypothetical protein